MIRELKAIEVEDVADIWLSTNITAHSFIPEHYWIENYEIFKEEYIPVSTTFIYEEDGARRAFISVIDDTFIGACSFQRLIRDKGLVRNYWTIANPYILP